MAFLGKARKIDLFKLVEELGIEATPDAKMVELKSLICKAPDFDEDFTKNMLESIIEARREGEKQELAETQARERKELAEIEARKTRELAEVEAQKQREFQEFELERLRLANIGNSGTNNSDSAPGGIPKRSRELQSIMQKYDPAVTDISLYLVMFERQARKAKVEPTHWVSHLMALLPLDIVHVILREPEEKSEDYEYIKKILLQRFKLSSEAFRVKFIQHQRRPGSLWKDFAFELKNYLDEWVKGVNVTDFDGLKDLMLSDQVKRRLR